MKRACVLISVVLVGSELSNGQSTAAIQEFGGLTSIPGYIVTGPDGALWFTEGASAPKIGRITTPGAIAEFPLPNPGGSPVGIAAGPDGALWFAELGTNKIGRITTAGAITEFPVPTAGSGPYGIVAGPDGALWFTESAVSQIGRITTAGAVTEFRIPTANSNPYGIAVGPDGALWFVEEFAGKIGRITTGGAVTEFSVPTAGSGPFGITAGPDGALWFTESVGDRIGRVTVSGVFTEFPTLTAFGEPVAIAKGPDGALWFTELNGNRIGRITTAGVIAEFPTPTAGNPTGITAGTDGAMWFTEGIGKIGRIVLSSAPPPPTVTQYTITTVAGNGTPDLPQGDNGPATAAAIVPKGVAADNLGNLFVIDAGSATGKRVSAVRNVDGTGTITTIACDGPDPLGVPPWGPVLPAHQALCGNLAGVAVDNSGGVLVTQSGGRTLDRLASGNISILSTDVNGPQNVAVDAAGNAYVADSGNCRILKVNPSGTSSIVAGGSCGFGGDNGIATNASLGFPQGVAVDSAGNVYIADTNNARVRKVNTSGIITTVAGSGCTSYGAGDGAPATGASLCYPVGVTVDSAGNLLIVESSAGLVRRVDTSGMILTIAGSEKASGVGDGGPATSATLSFPFSVSLSRAGQIYVADSGHYRVRMLTPTPAISTLTPNSATAGGPALTLQVNGTGFIPMSSVSWTSPPSNPVALQTSYISGNQLTAVVPANLIANPLTAQVTVSNPVAGNPSISSNVATFTVNPAITSGFTIITASPLPDGTVGSAYSQALSASGGATPYQGWAVIGGSLPPGVSLTTLGGVLTALLTGVPTAAGTFSFTVQVTDHANATATRQFSLTVSGGGMSISAAGIVNSASYLGGSVAPGEIVTIFGSGLGPAAVVGLQLDSRGYVSNSLGGTQVLFDGVAAPMIYTTATQVSAIVPYGASGTTQVHVVYQGQSSNVVSVPVTAAFPGIFTADSSGHGQGAIVNQDGTVNSPDNPAPAGSVVFVYATGEGQTNPTGVDGKPGDSPAPLPIAQPGMTATIDGVNAPVLYAGGVPGLVAGVLQVNLQIPATVQPGSSVPVQLSLGGHTSQTPVTLAIR
jgi:uncharacterized protein (TIGR03437 family)